MQLGIGTYTYGWAIGVKGYAPANVMNETGLIKNAVHAGIHLIQMGDNLPLHTFTSKRRKVFSDELQRQGIAIELGARKMTTAHLQKYILLCGTMNSSMLRFLVDNKNFKPGLKEIEKIIRPHISLLRDNGVSLAIENHDRLKASELRALIENIGCEEVGICLDTANSLGVGEGITTVVDKLAPYTLNLHIKDTAIKRLPYKMGFTVNGCLTGKGILDIPGLLQALRKYKKCRTAILEQWTEPESDIEKTVKKEQEEAMAGIRYLKELFKTNNNYNESI